MKNWSSRKENKEIDREENREKIIQWNLLEMMDRVSLWKLLWVGTQQNQWKRVVPSHIILKFQNTGNAEKILREKHHIQSIKLSTAFSTATSGDSETGLSIF